MPGLLGPEVGYVDLLDYETREHTKNSDGFNKTPLRPSASGNCTRELFYALNEFHGKAKYQKKEQSAETTRVFGLGHSVEYHIVKEFESKLKMVEVRYKQQVLSFGKLEAPTDKRLSQLLEGSIDACFIHPEWKCVVDFKSKKDKWSTGYKSQWDEMSAKLASMASVSRVTEKAYWVESLSEFLAELRDPFFEANFLQLNLYANSDFIKERGINHGAIIQYNKNDSRLREIRFKPCPKLYQKVKKKFETVLMAVEKADETLASKDHVLGSIKCAFCPFSQTCWGEDTLKAWFGTFPKKQWPKDTDRMGTTGVALDALFVEFTRLEALGAQMKETSEAILKLMAESNTNKVRTASGEVFEAKPYKSPFPRVELKRSKA